ncbi:MAG TPA: PepSY-associated TM helix domain-containing protein [Allosphingosinicella sp.]|jgi:uncharacterized iron-regulated membrane protein|nr:PepSY-associated TM helix domain-containing protein [Allosphingosinicella sp.]
MKAAIIRLYKAVHSWTGLICGLLLFVAFYAGAITMFKEPLAAWAQPLRAGVALRQAPRLIDQVLAERPDAADELTLELGTDGGDARLGWHDPDSGEFFEASRTAAGALAVAPPPDSYLARSIDLIHRAGGIPGDRDFSLYVMGAVALLYFLAIVSGLILILPRLARDLFALRAGRNRKRMWLDAHNAIGVVGLPFHVFIAVSVVIFAFGEPILNLQDRLVYDGRLDRIAQIGDPFAAAEPSGVKAPMLPPGQLLARLRAASPGFEAQRIVYIMPGDRNAVAMIGGRDPAQLSTGIAYARLGAVDGEIQDLSGLPGHGNAWNAWASGFTALHFGTFGGAPVRWAYFLLGLGGAFLFYSGNLLWIESRRRRARRAGAAGAVQNRAAQSRAARAMASATVGTAFGCIAGLSLSIAAAKWLHGHVADLASWHVGLYYGVFLPALAWAFARGAARSVVGLIAAAAFATALIPLASLAAAFVPALGLWNHGGATLGVDLIAAAGALALGWAALRTRRGLASIPRDSLWFAGRRPGPATPSSVIDACTRPAPI